jgi:mono/diheme cytochrome c family protein
LTRRARCFFHGRNHKSATHSVRVERKNADMQLHRLLLGLTFLFFLSASALADESAGQAEDHHHDSAGAVGDHGDQSGHGDHSAAASDGEGAATDASLLLSGSRMLDAQRRYESNCAGCHGSLKGDDAMAPAAPALAGTRKMAAMTAFQFNDALAQHHDPSNLAAWQAAFAPDDLVALLDYLGTPVAPPTPTDLAERGAQIYGRTCSVCHGEKGNAASWARDSLNPSPFDFTSEKAGKLTRQRMIHSVTYGVDGTAMMPFTTQLTRAEIAATVDYIRETFMTAALAAATQDHAGAGQVATGHGDMGQGGVGHSEAGQETSAGHGSGDDHHANHGEGFDAAAPLPDGLVGDALAGEKLYKTNCVDCHGSKGDGQGRRAYFMRKKPRDFTSDKTRAEFNRPHLFTAIAKGVLKTEMPAWNKVLTPQEIADLAEYVQRAFVYPQDLRSDAGSLDGMAPSWEKDDVKKN